MCHSAGCTAFFLVCLCYVPHFLFLHVSAWTSMVSHVWTGNIAELIACVCDCNKASLGIMHNAEMSDGQFVRILLLCEVSCYFSVALSNPVMLLQSDYSISFSAVGSFSPRYLFCHLHLALFECLVFYWPFYKFYTSRLTLSFIDVQTWYLLCSDDH